jgi:hypothetical protein
MHLKRCRCSPRECRGDQAFVCREDAHNSERRLRGRLRGVPVGRVVPSGCAPPTATACCCRPHLVTGSASSCC